MFRWPFLIAWLLLGCLPAAHNAELAAPTYSIASIVNAASNVAGALAPNTIATIYGLNLSFSTRAVSTQDIRDGFLPTVLAGVRVLVGGLPANLYYVSPTQINFLIPSILLPGYVDLVVVRHGVAGPVVRIRLLETAPGFFQLDPETAIATHADGRVVTYEDPARPGETIVLYATGLGRTIPDQRPGVLAERAAQIERFDELDLYLDNVAVPRHHVFYAGITPGFAGLYQVNVTLPEDTPSNPEIRLALGGLPSPPGIKLPVARQ